MLHILVDIVIDVRQRLSRKSGDELVAALSHIPGVSQVKVSVAVPRLVFVNYDPAMISTQHIIQAMAQRGISACLIGI